MMTRIYIDDKPASHAAVNLFKREKVESKNKGRLESAPDMIMRRTGRAGSWFHYGPDRLK